MTDTLTTQQEATAWLIVPTTSWNLEQAIIHLVMHRGWNVYADGWGRYKVYKASPADTDTEDSLREQWMQDWKWLTDTAASTPILQLGTYFPWTGMDTTWWTKPRD